MSLCSRLFGKRPTTEMKLSKHESVIDDDSIKAMREIIGDHADIFSSCEETCTDETVKFYMPFSFDNQCKVNKFMADDRIINLLAEKSGEFSQLWDLHTKPTTTLKIFITGQRAIQFNALLYAVNQLEKARESKMDTRQKYQ
jgi:hypothetical protein